jgi:tRNA(Met) C34 N-acetyltransferase TmcA
VRSLGRYVKDTVRSMFPLRNVLLAGALLTSTAFVLAGQEFSDRYLPLIRVLSLTDAQIEQLQQAKGDNLRTSLLDATQQFQIGEIAKALDVGRSAAAVVLGLMDAEEWPADWPCGTPSSAAHNYSLEFDLTAEQVRRFEQLQQDVRQQAVDQLTEIGKRYAKMLPGESLSPEEWATAHAETTKWVKQRDEARPPRATARAVLNGEQRAKLDAFRGRLELAREAVELHLIPRPGGWEILCH